MGWTGTENLDGHQAQAGRETQISLLVPGMSHIALVDGTVNCQLQSYWIDIRGELGGSGGSGQTGWIETDGVDWDRSGYLGHWALTM